MTNPPQSMTYAATLSDIRAAADRIKPYAHRTPIITCATINQMAGCQIFFKCEHMQKIGAFKFRGACNAIMKLDDKVAERGVVTHSSGNHAQAVALAATLRGIAAHIVMPTTASDIKRTAVRGYGGNVIDCDPDTASRENTADQVREKTGATLIHPYDNDDIIAGQGTAAMELIEDADDLDAIITPVGGGGLLSGTCVASKALKPDIRVFAGEPTGADDAARSMRSNSIMPQDAPDTIADGLLTSLGTRNWPIIRDHVEKIITVDDDKTVHAMRLMWQRAKLLIEPSSAVAVAALLSDTFKTIQNDQSIKRIGMILTGGNVDVDNLPW
jgi:threonine dehydratase